MTDSELSVVYDKIITNGPDRVVINEEGEGVSPFRASLACIILPTVIFIRADGWSLGAPRHLVNIAHKMWKDEWVAAMTYDKGLDVWRLQRLGSES